MQRLVTKKHGYLGFALCASVALGVGVARADEAEVDASMLENYDATAQLAPCVEPEDGVWVRVSVDGISSEEGNVRVQVYSDDPDDFLASGKKLVRVDVPAHDKDMDVCVPLPGQGDYALVVMHDKNANGKADIFSEGFGFSNNPKLRFGPPKHKDTVFTARDVISELSISLKYLVGSEKENKKDLRKSRRR